MALAGPVVKLLLSGPIATKPGSTKIKPSTATINKPNIVPDGIAPSSASGLYMISETNNPSSFATAGSSRSLEGRVPDPTQVENWLAVNKARILGHVASRRNTKPITEYFTSIT
jgi:hypothetical protein